VPGVDDARRGPIFIVGAMGSGTTLVRLVLDSHPHIAIPHETGFMRAYDAHRFAPFKHSGRGWARKLAGSEEELDAMLRDFYDSLFMRYAERHGKRRWGEKTPLHMWHVDDMARLFPDAQFIGVVRHPAGSIASNMRRFGAKLRRATWHWRAYARELARHSMRHDDRFVLVRYEDLVREPEPVLRELLEWLGEPWSDAVLAHHQVQGARGGKRVVEGRSRVDDPVDPSRIDRWTRDLRGDHHEWLAQRVTRMAQFYGYDVDDAGVADALTPPERRLIHGADVRQRLERFPEIDLSVPHERPPASRLYDPRKLTVVPREFLDELTAPRGVRRWGAAAVRRLPGGVRPAAVRTVRRTRKVLGLRRRPLPFFTAVRRERRRERRRARRAAGGGT